jgi:hypothetical protein
LCNMGVTCSFISENNFENRNTMLICMYNKIMQMYVTKTYIVLIRGDLNRLTLHFHENHWWSINQWPSALAFYSRQLSDPNPIVNLHELTEGSCDNMEIRQCYLRISFLLTTIVQLYHFNSSHYKYRKISL